MALWIVSIVRGRRAKQLGVVTAGTEKDALRKAILKFKVPIGERRALVAIEFAPELPRDGRG